MSLLYFLVAIWLSISSIVSATCPYKASHSEEVSVTPKPVLSQSRLQNAEVSGSGTLSELDAKSRKTLVAALHKAANLEQYLLNAYLIAAASTKCTPAEFAYLPENGTNKMVLNERRAIQFELARSWKTDMLKVGVEEMLHLHYVNSLLRALGEAPHFILPLRSNTSGWIIEDWEAVLAGKSIEVTVPLSKASITTIKNFVMYESTDSLQTKDPFSEEFSKKIKALHEWELRFRAAEALKHVNATADKRKEMVEELFQVYNSFKPGSDHERLLKKVGDAMHPDQADYHLLQTGPTVTLPKFASIADFYLKTVAPLYEEAFSFGWVVNNNRDLNNELQDPTILDASLLGVGPFYHSKNFMHHKKNYKSPLKNFQSVDSIIQEILAEGEGFVDFPKRLDELLAMDPIEYMPIASSFVDVGTYSKVGYNYERLRNSHLYKFTNILGSLRNEIKLSQKAGLKFDIARSAVPILSSTPGLKAMEQQVWKQFNQLNLVTCMWLSRIYEIPHWLGDQTHRNAIEQLATWPLMSLALRPFMELLSFFGDEVYNNIFRQDLEGLPAAPLHARELHTLYYSLEARSQEINERMDYLAVRVLADIAVWAEEQITAVTTDVIDATARRIMITKLKSLMVLKEFRPQFDYRVKGGYSDTAPKTNYFPPSKNANKFEESPVKLEDENPPLYRNSFVLHLRYAGYGTVQMATDPDPPTDEVGATGTLMLHAADAPNVFDRSLFWQPHEGVIERGPTAEKSKGMPYVGVNVVSASLEYTAQSDAKYLPYGNLNSVGAVQSNGMQLYYQLNGLTELLTLQADEIVSAKDGHIRLDLLKDEISGKRPFLNGENHLLWKDGEPIDPYHLSISVDGGKGPNLFRSIFAGDKNTTMLQMTPEQREKSKRGPIGFIDNRIPSWAYSQLSDSMNNYFNKGMDPQVFLDGRLDVLDKAMKNSFAAGLTNQTNVDKCISYAERARILNRANVKGTTFNWLRVFLQYAHTVSGLQFEGSDYSKNDIIQKLSAKTGLPLTLSQEKDRNVPNSRWLNVYCLAAMDTDALTNVVHGDLYIPLTLMEVNKDKEYKIEKKWIFPAGSRDIVYSFTSDFCKCFWVPTGCACATDKHTRTINTPDAVITETYVKNNGDGYEYSLAGVDGVSKYHGAMMTTENDKREVVFIWTCTYQCENAESILRMNAIMAGAANGMNAAFNKLFAVKSG